MSKAVSFLKGVMYFLLAVVIIRAVVEGWLIIIESIARAVHKGLSS